MRTFPQRYRKTRISVVETFLKHYNNVLCLTLHCNVSTTLQRLCEFGIRCSCLKIKNVPFYEPRQSVLAQEARNLHANNQPLYRLEYLLSKRFSNIRITLHANVSTTLSED